MHRTTPRSILVLAAFALLFGAPVRAQDFSKYVALGDSLTAGFESGCLVQRNQANSYPAVLARTFGIDDFQQPLVQEIPLTSPLVGNPCLGPIFVPPSTITVGNVSQMGPPLNALLPRPYDNLGMPGAQVADLTELRHGDPNGDSIQRIAALVLRNVPGSPFDGANAVDEANILLAGASGSTLLSLWIGNNDVLGAATSGIVVDGVTVTSVADFTVSYQAILDTLVPSTEMVRANIPDVTSIPFTTTIPPVLVDPATRQPVIIDGQVVPLLGPGDAAFPCPGPLAACSLPSGTLVTLPASSLLAQGIGIPVAAGGTGLPLPHGQITDTGLLVSGVVLYPDEVALLQARVNEYNAVIAANGTGALVDIHSFFDEVRSEGFEVGGVQLTTAFVTGGVFSNDGVHPSSIGYTIVADQFIQALNEQSGTDLPRPNFADVLFTSNTPVIAGAVQNGGPWGYDFAMWEGVLASTLGRGTAFALPSIRATRSDRPTRVVTRGAD